MNLFAYLLLAIGSFAVILGIRGAHRRESTKINANFNYRPLTMIPTKPTEKSMRDE